MTKKNKILAAADKYISQQKYEKALNELLNVVKMTPSDTNLLNKVGDLYALTNNKKSAISYFEKVAQSYHRSGFYPKAIAVYKKINRLDDSYMDAREKLVELYLQQGHQSEAKGELKRMAEFYTDNNLPGRALDVYHKLVEIEPNNIDVRIKLTEILIREGKADEASSHFLSMGRDLIEKNMVNEARKILSQATKFAPDNVKIQILLAKASISEGKVDEGIMMLTDICESAPHDLEAVVTLGEAYLGKNQLTHAKTCFLRAVHISKDYIQPLEDVAKMLIENGELDEAFGALDPVCDSLMSRNEPEEATRLYRTILYADETHAPSLLKLVEIYRKSNQTSNAILTYEKLINHAMAKNEQENAQKYIGKLLELDPDNLEWRAKMDSLSGLTAEDALGLSSDAVAELSASLSASASLPVGEESEAEIFSLESPENASLEPNDPETQIQNHLTEADVFIKYGIMDQALTHLIAIIDLDPRNFEANVRLKQLYGERGEVDKAVACLTNLASICMESRRLGEAEEFLDEAERYKPGVARLYRGKLESLRSEEMDHHLEDGSQHGFDIELSGEAVSTTSGDLVFRDVAPEDVVDFGAMDDEREDEGSWSLKMNDGEDDLGFDFSVSEQEGQDMLGQEIHVDANDDSMQFFEHVDETEMLDEADESSFALPSLEDEEGELEADVDFGDIDELSGDLEDDLGAVSLEESEEDLAADFRAEFGLGPEQEEDADVKVSVDLGHLLSEELGDLDILDGDVEEPDVAEIELNHDRSDDEENIVLVDGELDEDDVALDEPVSEMDFGDSIDEPFEAPEVELEAPPVPATTDLEEVDVAEVQVEAPTTQDLAGLENELEEIDFFLSMEAYDDAVNLVEEAVRKFGEVPELIERRETIERMKVTEQVAPTPAPTPVAKSEPDGLLDGGGFFDLAAELKEELFEESSEVTDNAQPEEIQSVEELFEEFKKGVAEQIDEDDFETHYDLGIAYKEMGLLEESISEFRKAQGDKKRFMECTAMIGACLVELGRSEEAVSHYRAALDSSLVKGGEKLAIKYELALVCEGLGEIEDALDLFREIQGEKPGYRDTDSHIEALV
ncbi:MAG: tetratricopeptide repeat protein [Acidobacteria bacterium]|nr:tetratricopeptide repeat protein [Acidobacteriota bacterium]